MLRAQLRMDSRGWGSDVLWSRQLHEQRNQRLGSSPSLWTPTSAFILYPLNFRGRKGLVIIKSNLPIDSYKNYSGGRACAVHNLYNCSLLGTLSPAWRTVWRGWLAGSVRSPREPGLPTWPLLTAPVLCSGCLGHTWPVDAGTITITSSKPQAKWLLPTGYPTTNSLADSTQLRPREIRPIQVLVAQNGRSL